MTNILVVDNFDSFTYNLVHYLEDNDNVNIDVVRNNDPSLTGRLDYSGILLSPGPGLPIESGYLMEVIKRNFNQVPILGICLGMQAIVEQFGGKLSNMSEVLHGRKTKISAVNKDDGIFRNIPNQLEVGRYHSWCVEIDNVPKDLQVLYVDENKQVMALKHHDLPIYGVQFHPESILSSYGKSMIGNWINLL